MFAEDSPEVLVARFLRLNNYNETLNAFLTEAKLPPDTGISTSKDVLTVEQILQEKREFDLSVAFEKVGIDERADSWTVPAPCVPTTIETLPLASNVLHVSVGSVNYESDGKETEQNLLLATGADRRVSFLSATPPYALVPTKIPVSDSPVLSTAFLSSRYCVTTSMSGKITLHDLIRGGIVDERRDHSKYAVKIACFADGPSRWVATAGWDSRVMVYYIPSLETEKNDPRNIEIGAPITQIKLQTNPEAILFLNHPEIATPVLLLSRRDSTFLYYYAISENTDAGINSGKMELQLLGRQNLAPHSNTWVAFTPSAFALSPLDPSILAVATSAIPSMKLVIVRLLLPPPKTASARNLETNVHLTQAAQARASLAIEDREAAAIMIYCTTHSPQTPYSTPALAWRPDATGIYVNGDDGVVRGIEARSGKVIASLADGHEVGAKIRCLWAGWADHERQREIVVSGGFDRRLVVWNVEK